MRVLLDHNISHKFRHLLTGHYVATARYMGWAELVNGQLIVAAENAGFEVLLTADQGIYYQQSNLKRQIALVVVGSTRWPDLEPHFAEIQAAIQAATPGAYLPVRLK